MIKTFRTRLELYRECIPVNGIGAELGVADGTNAHNLIEIAKPRLLHLVDPWPASYLDSEENFQKVWSEFNLNPITQVHRVWDHDWLKWIEDKSLDWVYLDTDHTYETTRRELELLRSKVRMVIAGHDFCCTANTLHPGTADWEGGVMRAVIEEIQDGYLEMIGLTSPQCGCSAMDGFPSWACRVTEKS